MQLITKVDVQKELAGSLNMPQYVLREQAQPRPDAAVATEAQVKERS
jgi:hypothetical protein